MRPHMKLLIPLVALAALLATAPHKANMEIMLHDEGDTSPNKVNASVQLVGLAVSVLVSWSGSRDVTIR